MAATATHRRLGAAALLVAALLAGVVLFIAAARAGWLRPDDATLRSRYALEASRFITVGGQDLHVVDQGRGPVVVLVHGSYGSLRMWDAWADALLPDYRVIRFDRPGQGLSGPSPDARYDGTAEAGLIGAFADELGLGSFFLVGTSSSGESVAAFAALRPDRVRGIVLANTAAGVITPHPVDGPWWFELTLAADPYLGGWRSRLLWRGVLERNFANPDRVTSALVREWTELNNRAQGWPRAPRPDGRPPFARTPDDLRRIRAPALVLWSDKDPETTLEVHGQRTLELLAAEDKRLVVVDDCGHMLPIECGPASARAARAFFDSLTRVEPR